MTIKSKPSVISIQTFLNMFPIYWSNSDKKRLVIGEETSEYGAVKIMLIFAGAEI